MFNTIILKMARNTLSKNEFKKYSKGDCIFEENIEEEELKRWTIEEKANAQDELKKYKCQYSISGNNVYITEYALEYCQTNDDGEIIMGSDFDLAEEE
nr:MAG TPA: hypothetical protein [Caudoviricetes sp.]